MANKRATGKKARRAPELASRIRDLLISALDLVDQDGESVEELLARQARENPFRFLEVASKFVPKDVNYGGDPENPIVFKVEREFVSGRERDSGSPETTEEARILN